MNFGFSVAQSVGGLRGAGLGNQLLPIAKAIIGAQLFGKTFVAPPWGLNSRPYRSEFRSPRLDWLGHLGLAVLGRSAVGPVGTDLPGRPTYEQRLLADGRKPPAVIIHDSDMQFGYYGLASARAPLFRYVERAAVRDPALRIAARHRRSDGPNIAIHVRAGDFAESAPEPGGFNRRLPWTWYENVAFALSTAFRNLSITVVTEPDALDVAADRIQSAAPRANVKVQSFSATADLITAAAADLLVCSASSFSLGAAYLSNRPYIYYGQSLHSHAPWSSIWGVETEDGPTATSITAADGLASSGQRTQGRGLAISDASWGKWPHLIADWFENYTDRPEFDLVQHGVTRALG